MSRYFPIGVLAILFTLCVFGCTAPGSAPAAAPPSEPRVLRLGATPWVPFTGKEGQPRVAAYLVERALERAGYQARTSIVPDGKLTPALEDGRFDGSPAMWLSAEREKFLLYSKAYLQNRLLLVGPKGSDVSARSFADLAGKRIAIVEGYAYGPELEASREPVFVKVPSAEENLRAVISHRVDYCLLDALVVEFLFEQHAKEAPERLAVGTTPLVSQTLHFAVRKDLPDAATIIKRFNDTVSAMVRDGTYNLALQVTWITADVDGDGRAELVPQGPYVGVVPPTRSYPLFETSTSPAPSIMTVQEQTRYYVNGQTYGSWEEIPDSLKLQPGANQVGAGHPQVKLIEW